MEAEGGGGGRGLLRVVQESISEATITAIHRRYFNDTRGLALIRHLAAPHCAYVERHVACKCVLLTLRSSFLLELDSWVTGSSGLPVTHRVYVRSWWWWWWWWTWLGLNNHNQLLFVYSVVVIIFTVIITYLWCCRYYCLAAAAAVMKYIEHIQHVTYAPHSLHVVLTSSENTMTIGMCIR